MSYTIDKHARCAVIGYGSWATALVKILLENEKRVGWFIRDPEVLQYIKKNETNPRYLRDVHFTPSRLRMSTDLDQVVKEADVVILAVPSAFLKDVLTPLTVSLKEKFVVSAIKGIIPGDYVTVAEYLHQAYALPYDQIGIISGPCHSEEVALEKLSYLTLVCKSMDNACVLAEKFRTDYIKASCSTDIYGAEYAAVLKNIYAIAVGICHGLGYGDNFQAVLIANAAMEMSRFMTETYPCGRDITASAYLGDLLVTSYSQFSRNRTFGQMIGKGYSVKTAQIEMSQIAEGYYASACIAHINKRHQVSMPIADAVYKILYEKAVPSSTVAALTQHLI